MPLIQAHRPYRLTTPLGPDVLVVVGWSGEEHVSSLFRFTVRAVSEKADLLAKDVLLRKVTLALALPDGSDRTIHGVVSRFSRGGSAPSGLVAYELEIVPPQWALGLGEGFGIFQGKTPREACDAMLAGTPHDWRLSSTPSKRPYCVRYRESRWHFVSRLLEQEGIWYRFDHRAGEAKLLMCDGAGSVTTAWGVDALEFNEIEIAEPRLTQLRVDAVPYVAKTTVRTATEWLPASVVENVTHSKGAFKPSDELAEFLFEQQLAAHRDGMNVSGSDNPADVAKFSPDVLAYSRLRQERAETLSVCFRGASRYAGLEAGAKTTVKGHPNPAMNAELFVISVVHEGSNGGVIAGDNAVASYRNSFTAIPVATPYRPAAVTPWPSVAGTHTGIVVGPDGEEIFTDKHGRVQVLLKWDVDPTKTAGHTCWMRVAQSFAGQQFGSVFLPRIGQEVLIDFMDGNPDNPVIVGSLYNAANMPPWTLPDHKTRSGVRTKSTKQGAADHFNELRFDDKKSAEQIFVQAQKDLDTVVKNNETRQVGNDRTTTIEHDETKTVEKGNETTTIKKGEQKITVADNTRTLHVEKDHNVTVNGQETVLVKHDRKIEVHGTLDHFVKVDHITVVKGKEVTIITGDSATEVKDGNSLLKVKEGDISIKAGQGSILVKAESGAIEIKAMQGIELKVGENSILIDNSGVTIKGIAVSVQGTATAELKAPMAQVNGDAMVMINGKVTMIN